MLNCRAKFLSKLSFPAQFRPGLLALLVAAMVVAGCSSNSEEQTNNDTNDTNNNAPTCVERKILEREDVNGGVTLEKDCYTVESRLTVDDGVLTLKPGVSIEFTADAGFQFSDTGGLSAVGTSEDPVFLTGAVEERGHWAGLYFDTSDTSTSTLDHAVLSHAGSKRWHGGAGSQGGIYLRGGQNQLDISNTTFSHNAQAAIIAESGELDLTIDSSSFRDNEAPLWLNANLLKNLSALTFSDNENAYILTGLDAQSLDTEQTWKAFDVPYRSSHTIELKETLTLDAGVTVEFDRNAGLEIGEDGALTAQGSADKMIRFTGVDKERGAWKGIYYYGSTASANILEYVRVEFAGGDNWHGGLSTAGLYLRGDDNSLKISHSEFLENAEVALLADGSGVELSVESSTFKQNALPIWLPANKVGALSDDTGFTDNDASYVLIGPKGPRTEISDSQIWAALPVPYRAHFDIEVTSDLTLSPGITFTFEKNTGLAIDGGTLSADATGGERIKFIAADAKTDKGFWQGIYFVGSTGSDNKIANADILYAGSDGWNGAASSQANLYLRGGGSDDSSLALSNVKIAGSGHYGISVDNGSTIDPCEEVTVEDNTDEDISGDGASACN